MKKSDFSLDFNQFFKESAISAEAILWDDWAHTQKKFLPISSRFRIYRICSGRQLYRRIAP